jgi:hypothetical protein
VTPSKQPWREIKGTESLRPEHTRALACLGWRKGRPKGLKLISVSSPSLVRGMAIYETEEVLNAQYR